MNNEHLHMMINHFPIIGTIFGLGILLTGMFLKNKSVKNTAFVVFIFSALFVALSMATGEGAEEVSQKLPSVTKELIHQHEEMAEKLALVLYITGLFSLISIYSTFKRNPLAKLTSFITLILSAVGIFFALQTGITGGSVRHTEIRNDFVPFAGKYADFQKTLGL